MEDHFEDLMDLCSRFGNSNYFVDPVKSVFEALEKLQNEKYSVYIFDLKILPGDNPEWQALDKRKRIEKPQFDPYLVKKRRGQASFWLGSVV